MYAQDCASKGGNGQVQFLSDQCRLFLNTSPCQCCQLWQILLHPYVNEKSKLNCSYRTQPWQFKSLFLAFLTHFTFCKILQHCSLQYGSFKKFRWSLKMAFISSSQKAQCGNLRIFLFFRFYVKSISTITGLQSPYTFMGDIFSNFCQK